MSKKVNKRFFLALLAVFGTILALGFFELILRLTMPAPENLAKLRSSNLFLLENKPGATFPYVRSGEYNNVISINSSGFRDDEFVVAREPGTIRIAVLGDSQEEALQVPLYATWQKVMARKLSRESKVKVESYNFGVSGYGTDQQWLTLREKVWSFSPDMVILAFSPNDVGDTFKNRLVEVRNGRLEVISAMERAGGNFLGKAVRQTYIYHMIASASGRSKFTKSAFETIRTNVLGLAPDERFFLSDAQLVQGPFEVVASQKNPSAEVTEAWEAVRALTGDMRRQAKDHGAEFLITINIPRAQVRESDWLYLRDLYKLDPDTSSPYEINEVLAGIAASLGINFYDPRLDAIEWRRERGDLHFEDDAHFNINGNEFMGTKVAEYMLENRLIQ